MGATDGASYRVAGRGYRLSDSFPVFAFGVVADFTAAVVLTLYMGTEIPWDVSSNPRCYG